MTVRISDIPRIVVERIASAHPNPAHFGYAEVCDWPDGALHELMRSGLLTEADRARSIVCPGCEWQCHKTPTVRLDSGHQRRVYISCDEEPRHGRIHVAAISLNQHQAHVRSLSNCVAGLMGFETARSFASGNGYELGRVKGRHGARTVGLLVDEAQVSLIVGDHREPLLSILSLSSYGLFADQSVINRLANRKTKATGRDGRVSDRTRQQALQRETQRRDAAIYREAKKLKAEGMTWSDAARELEGTQWAPGLSSGRIRRIITEKRSAERKKSRSNR